MYIRYCCGALVAALTVAGAVQPAAASPKFFDQLRFGVYQHDTDLVGHRKEKGVDFDLEALSRPVTALRIIGSPRIVMGASINSAGYTDQVYLGLNAQWNFVTGVFSNDDGFFVGGFLGGAWQDGKIDVRNTPLEQHWKSHGSHFLFRTGMEFGYRINSVWSVALNFNHISNAGLAKPNEGQNDLGLRIGIMI